MAVRQLAGEHDKAFKQTDIKTTEENGSPVFGNGAPEKCQKRNFV